MPCMACQVHSPISLGSPSKAEKPSPLILEASAQVGSTALLSAVWCGPQSGYTVMALPGVGWMPVTKSDSNGDEPPPSPEANQ